MNLSRRTILTAAPLGILAIAAGCSTTTSTLTPAEILTDAGAVVSGLANGLNAIKSSPLLVPYAALIAKIEGYLADATAAVAGLNTGLPAATGASIVQQIENDINDVLSVATAPPLGTLIPAPFSTALGMASVVLPVLEAFVNQYLPTKAASLAAVSGQIRARALAPAGLTVAQAVAGLQSIK